MDSQKVRSLGVYALLAFFSMPFLQCAAQANLDITASFDKSITDMADSDAIMSVINSTLSIYNKMYTNNVTISLDFTSVDSGVGESTTTVYSLPYTTYLSQLTKDKQGDDTSFLKYIQANAMGGNPVNGNANIKATSAELRAIGIADAVPNSPNAGTNYDSVIGLNFSVLNISRENPDDLDDDLQTVVEHEVDETLGMQSALDAYAKIVVGTPPGAIGPMDLYRYDINGNRSFTTSSAVSAYFSVDGGKTDLQQFNQNPNYDYQDWTPSSEAFVQDAVSTPGADPNLALPELTALDVLGYNTAAPAPESSSFTVFGGMLLGALLLLLRPTLTSNALRWCRRLGGSRRCAAERS